MKLTPAALCIAAIAVCGFDQADWRRLEWEGAWVGGVIERNDGSEVLLRITDDVFAPRTRNVALPAGTVVICERVAVRGDRLAGSCRTAQLPGEPGRHRLHGWLSSRDGSAGIPVNLKVGKRAGVALIDEPQLKRLEIETRRLVGRPFDQ